LILLPQSARRHEALTRLDAGHDCGNNHASGEAPHFKKKIVFWKKRVF